MSLGYILTKKISLISVDARKIYAKRQNRDLLASEIEEARREMENLKEAEQSETGLVVNNVRLTKALNCTL